MSLCFLLSLYYIYIPLHPSVLAPASIVNVLPSELHFSRSLEGEPIVIPSRVASPPPPLPLPPLKKGDRSAGVQELQFALIQTSLMRPSTIRFQYVFCLSLEISRSLSLSLSLAFSVCMLTLHLPSLPRIVPVFMDAIPLVPLQPSRQRAGCFPAASTTTKRVRCSLSSLEMPRRVASMRGMQVPRQRRPACSKLRTRCS